MVAESFHPGTTIAPLVYAIISRLTTKCDRGRGVLLETTHTQATPFLRLHREVNGTMVVVQSILAIARFQGCEFSRRPAPQVGFFFAHTLPTMEELVSHPLSFFTKDVQIWFRLVLPGLRAIALATA